MYIKKLLFFYLLSLIEIILKYYKIFCICKLYYLMLVEKLKINIKK